LNRFGFKPKFSYVFECDDPSCKIQHDLMIEDWEICQLYRSEKLRVGEKESLLKVAEKYKDVKILCGDILAYKVLLISRVRTNNRCD